MSIDVKATEEYKITFNPEGQTVPYHMTLSRSDATILHRKLGEILGGSAPVGMVIPRNSAEPDVPVGTRVRDNTGDVGVKAEFGWKWEYINGDYMSAADSEPWEVFRHDYDFVVIS